MQQKNKNLLLCCFKLFCAANFLCLLFVSSVWCLFFVLV